MAIKKKIAIIALSALCITLLAGCFGNADEESSSAPAPSKTSPAPTGDVKTTDMVKEICAVTSHDAEQAITCLDALEEKLNYEGLSILKLEPVFTEFSDDPTGMSFYAEFAERNLKYEVGYREDNSPIVFKMLTESNEQALNPNQQATIDEGNRLLQDDEKTSNQDRYSSYNSPETFFDTSTSLNLKVDDVSSVLGSDVANRLLDDINVALASWGVGVSDPLNVEVSPDVTVSGDSETFLICVYVDINHPIFRCTYDLNTMDNHFELMP